MSSFKYDVEPILKKLLPIINIYAQIISEHHMSLYSLNPRQVSCLSVFIATYSQPTEIQINNSAEHPISVLPWPAHLRTPVSLYQIDAAVPRNGTPHEIAHSLLSLGGKGPAAEGF